MIEFLPIKIETTFDWSLILAIVGGIAFYFGKLINEVSPLKENKYSIYVHGAVFVVLYVLFPPLVIYTILQKHILTINWIVALLLQFVISYYLGLRLKSFNLEKIKLKDYVSKIVDTKTKEIYSKVKLLEKNKNKVNSMGVFDSFFFGRIPDWILIILAILLYWFTYCVLIKDVQPILVFLSILMLVVSLSILAILQSWNNVRKYPVVTIHLENGKELKEELTKIEEGFINIISGNKIYHITDSRVLFIEKDVLIDNKKTKKTKTN